MDNFRLFNDRSAMQLKHNKRRRRPGTCEKMRATVAPSVDLSTVMFPECFYVKGLDSNKSLFNRTATNFTSNATKRMFRRLAESRANTA